MSSATGLLFFQELDYIFKTVFWGRNRRMTMDSEKKKEKKSAQASHTVIDNLPTAGL